MPGRGRRGAGGPLVLGPVPSAGRWGSDFLTERLWEASVSEAVATAGARRALLALALELSVLLLAVAWLVGHVVVAARIALPDYPPPDREHAQVWPAKLPRWTLTAGAVVLGALVGSRRASIGPATRTCKPIMRLACVSNSPRYLFQSTKCGPTSAATSARISAIAML